MKIRFFLLFLFAYFYCFGQKDNKLDSLNVLLKKGTISTFEYNEKLFKSTYKTDINRAKKHAFNALQIANNDKQKMTSYSLMGTYYLHNQKYDSVTHYLNKVINNSNSSKVSLATAYNNLGVMNLQTGNYEKALKHFDKSLALRLTHDKTPQALVEVYNNRGSIYAMQGKLENCITQFIKALKIANKNNLKANSAIITYNIGLNYGLMGNSNKAIEYITKTKRFFISKNQNNRVAQTNVALAEHYLNLNNVDQAFKIIRENLNFSNLNPRNRASSLFMLGNIYYDKKQYTKCILKIKEALKIDFELNNLRELAEDYNLLGLSYSSLKQFKKANSYFSKANDILIKTKDTFNLIQNLDYSLTNKLVETKNIKLFDDYKKLNKKYFDSKRQKSVYNLETKYQTQQKENQILKLANENEKQKVTMARTRLLLFSIITLVALLGIFGYFIRHKRKQQQKLELLEKTIEASDNEKNRIGRELHDGIASKILQLVHNAESLNETHTYKLQDIYTEIRGLSHQLNQTPTHSEEPIFERLLEITDGVYKQKINIETIPISLAIKEPIATHIYRIVQELVANTTKHSEASEIYITLSHANNDLHLSYKDDGKSLKKIIKGKGLQNIEHRINLLKGSITYNTEENTGFTTQIIIPV